LCNQWAQLIREQDPDAEIWVYEKPVETKQGSKYRDRFLAWLRGEGKERIPA